MLSADQIRMTGAMSLWLEREQAQSVCRHMQPPSPVVSLKSPKLAGQDRQIKLAIKTPSQRWHDEQRLCLTPI